MCNQCTTDPRDELAYGAKALTGLADLVGDLGRSGSGFDRTSPAELSELLDMVRARIDSASSRLEDYIPRT